jgi:hypothetical protein
MPDEPGKGSPKRPTSQPGQDTHAYRQYRRGLDEAARSEIPALPSDLLYGTIAGLVASIGLTFAPWLRYIREDGSVGTTSGIRGDGFVLVLASVVAVVAFAIAGHRAPGDAGFPATIGFVATIIGFLAVGYTMMDPGFIPIDEPELPVSISRAWGLPSAFIVMLVTAYGAFRLWRIAGYY